VGLCFVLLLPAALAWFLFPRVDVTSLTTVPSAASVGTSAGPATPTTKTRVELRGTVVDASKTPISGAKVTWLVGGKKAGNASSRGDGSFVLKVAASAGVLEVSKNGFQTTTLELAIDALSNEHDLVLSEAVSIKGSVVDEAGNAVSGAMVICASGNKETALTDATGQFTFPPSADGCSATASFNDQISQATTLKGGAPNELTLQGPAKISGQVRQEDGSPLTKYSIGVESFQSSSGTRSKRMSKQVAVDDTDGAFTLNGLAPGSYVLVATAEGRPPAKSRLVEVAAGEHVRGVTIQLGRGGIVSGSVTDRESGKPIARATVRLDAASSSGAFFKPTMTDDAGVFELEGVPTESFSIRVAHPEYKERIITIDRSSSASLTIDLGKKGDGTDMEMTGIGATLMQGERFVEIASVIAGSPSEAAKLEPGDRIERIEGRDAGTFSVSDCVQRLRGAEGTRVTVTVGRGSTQFDVTLTRAKISR
jgi:protocatechuate 3,4-dioxygenase beta subunit